MFLFYSLILFFFKQKTAYEVRISDWSSDVCSSDLIEFVPVVARAAVTPVERARVVDVQAVVRPAADHAGVRFAHRVVGDHRLAVAVAPGDVAPHVHPGLPRRRILPDAVGEGSEERGEGNGGVRMCQLW